MARPKFRYSRWDGSQTGFELDAESMYFEKFARTLDFYQDDYLLWRYLWQQLLHQQSLIYSNFFADLVSLQFD